MSLKVYTGVKFRTNKLEEALKQLKSIRHKALENMAKSLEGRNFYGLAEKMDKYVISKLKDYKEGKCTIDDVKYEMVYNLSCIGDNINECRTHMELDYPLHIMIYSYKGKLYGHYFGMDGYGNDELLKTVVDDYWYGDSGDPDPNIPTRQWNQRQKVWEGIFLNNYEEDGGTPTKIGVLFEITKWDWINYKDIPDEVVKKLLVYLERTEEKENKVEEK